MSKVRAVAPRARARSRAFSIAHRSSTINHRGFTLVEAAISCVLVSLVFAAGMTAAGVAARDRRTQSDTRTAQALARLLMDEIAQQRYADPATNTIAPAANASTTDRSNWSHIDDYNGLAESPPRDRSGYPIAGAMGWKWSASVAYSSFPTFAGSSATAPSGGLVGGLLGAVTGTVTAVLGSTSGATDTGLKKIMVTLTSPTGVSTTITSFRSSAGVVDRVSTGTGFMSQASLAITVGANNTPIQIAAPLLNTPPNP
jgi:type II secretory pathway pseudopilin PulG